MSSDHSTDFNAPYVTGGSTLEVYVDISDLPKGAVLAELFNHSKPVGMGVLQARFGPERLTAGQAEDLIGKAGDDHDRMFPEGDLRRTGKMYFDYLYGRPLKLDLSGDAIDVGLYDRDNGGPGTAERLIRNLRQRLASPPRQF